ncbi:MAG: tail fiber domain-containing protein [Flavobacteriales bacterium]|nr:MAG: tail fiber domain-containing protein [Flavobacteriales bacterium]
MLNGTTNPASAVGSNGDFYLNTTTSTLFGPKAAGAWPAGVALIGPVGPQGPAGPAGSSNAWGITGNTGMVLGTNFIGNTDNAQLEFRVNNERGGFVTPSGTSTSFGHRALMANSGSNNTAVGKNTLMANTTSSGNTAMGAFAQEGNITGANNTALGSNALRSNVDGFSNVAVGAGAMRNAVARWNCVAVGDSALLNNGIGATYDPIDGPAEAVEQTAVGSKALYANTTGTRNVAVGFEALRNNVSGDANVAVGRNALRLNTSGGSNTGIGINALSSVATQSGNTALGSYAGSGLTMTNSSYVGNNAYPTVAGLSNATGLGYQARPTASNSARVGNTAVTSIGGYASWTTLPSDGRFKSNVLADVKGLDFILRLRPVTYNVNVQALAEHLGEDRRVDANGKVETVLPSPETIAARAEKAAVRQTGFIAQEVDAAAQAVGFDFSGVDKMSDGDAMLGLRYAEFVVPLVKAVQEQQAIIERLEKRIAELERR